MDDETTDLLLEVEAWMSAAHLDISQHLQVAKYNLRGECAGQIMERPDPPQLIHEKGIEDSEKVLEDLKMIAHKISKALKS